MHDVPPDATYDPSPGQPLDPSSFDAERVRGLIELSLATHPNRVLVDHFLRAGAEFTLYRLDDGRIEIALIFNRDRSPALAAIRAEASGGEIELLEVSEYGERVRISQAP